MIKKLLTNSMTSLHQLEVTLLKKLVLLIVMKVLKLIMSMINFVLTLFHLSLYLMRYVKWIVTNHLELATLMLDF